MKILFYNWVPFDEENRGGGVTVYTRNLINGILKKYPNQDITFLCAGSYYDTNDRTIRCEELQLKCNIRCKAFTIVNSPVFAPAYLSFYHLNKMINDNELKKVFFSFLVEKGPFDIVHFQNFEGLSLETIACKNKFPKTKFIYSIHNYYAFCPRVDLWRNNSENCSCLNTGSHCLDCMICHVPSEKLKRKMYIDYMQRKDNTPDTNYYNSMRKEIDAQYAVEELRPLSFDEREELRICLNDYRRKLVNVINENMDVILAVSERVKEIALKNGIKKEKIRTSYIGTDVAENAINYYKGVLAPPVTMVYMGYQNKEKGFFFLMDVLNKMEPEISKKMNVMILARGSFYTEEMLNLHKRKFNNAFFQNGYKREEILSILSQADFGIVPVLWEDNLPQVAIEMAANGVPVLCSDRGGVKELTSNPNFIFKADDVCDCIKKITQLINCPNELKEYYRNYRGLTTMDKHVEELCTVVYS